MDITIFLRFQESNLNCKMCILAILKLFLPGCVDNALTMVHKNSSKIKNMTRNKYTSDDLPYPRPNASSISLVQIYMHAL